MGREPEIIEGQFDVRPGSAKAGAEVVKRPGYWLPTIMTLLSSIAAAYGPNEPESAVRIVVMLALGFTWPFWRAIQLFFWSARCKVSEADAEDLAIRHRSRFYRRSNS